MVLQWLDSKQHFEQITKEMEAYRLASEAHFDSLDRTQGYCVSCEVIRTLKMPPPVDGTWRDLRESFICTSCGLNGRMRSIVWALRPFLRAGLLVEQRILMLERVTPLYAYLSGKHERLEGCEYITPNKESGSIHKTPEGVSVRHEDLLNLSYDSNSFDLVFHGDVLEHVPDHARALSECCRVLKPGGRLLFTCPFFGSPEHKIRARLRDDEIEHLLPPIYHGNPVSTDGSLVFVEHGWTILEDIGDAGFSASHIGIIYDPFQGIVSNNNPYREGHMWPVIFRAIK